MTDQEMQIAIAEACGWRQYEIEEVQQHFPGGMLPAKVKRWFVGEINPALAIGGAKQPPDYLNDLNAMHGAEKTLDGEQWDIYATWLCITTDYKTSPLYAHELIRATARQRAEAFLRTLGKWRDSDKPSQP